MVKYCCQAFDEAVEDHLIKWFDTGDFTVSEYAPRSRFAKKPLTQGWYLYDGEYDVVSSDRLSYCPFCGKDYSI